MLNRGEVVLYFVAGKETSKLLVNELSFVVNYHRVRYPEASEDVLLNKLPSLGSRDGG